MINIPRFSTALILSTCVFLQAQPAETKKPAEAEETPLTLPGAESIPFKKVDDGDLLLHVIKPKDAKASEKRACLVAFFGGGWTSGTPEKSIGWAKWASKLGMVGIAPDYRTKSRFKTTPEDCVADGRSAVRWIQEHASELGIDPAKIVVLGSSAGGHVGAWTAITDPQHPASDPAPMVQPAALILLWPVTDTSAAGYGGPKRFSNDEARANAMAYIFISDPPAPDAVIDDGLFISAMPSRDCRMDEDLPRLTDEPNATVSRSTSPGLLVGLPIGGIIEASIRGSEVV
jgi:acetyl esterase/lipase